jgi:hypothetical protein
VTASDVALHLRPAHDAHITEAPWLVNGIHGASLKRPGCHDAGPPPGSLGMVLDKNRRATGELQPIQPTWARG